MKIVLAGQLDRVYSNALAHGADQAEDGSSEGVDDARLEQDRPLIHRAATLAALSGTVVTAPDWYPGSNEDDEKPSRPQGKDPRFAPGMSLTRGAWADLYDDAAAVVKAVDFLGSYSERSQAILDGIEAPDAWVEDDSPRSLQRAIDGAAHVYLTDLLLQPFLAWQAGAVLVITEADCHLLADVAEFLIEKARPRPLPIPDLRAVVRAERASNAGKLPNLGIEDVAEAEARRQDPKVQAYARQLDAIVAAPELLDVGPLLEAARLAAHSAGVRFEGGAETISIVVEHAEILSNVGVQVAPRMKAMVRYARRQFASKGLRTLVLIENSSNLGLQTVDRL